MDVDKQALRERAESTIGILENIAGFEPSDIDGDSVELRFETEGGFDTGCDVSIVDQCQKAADVIRALLDDLEAAEKRNVELSMLLEGADAIQTDYAEALECQDDNDSVLAAIVALKQRAESAEKHIAELRDWNLGLAQESLTHQQRIAELSGQKRLIGWRASDYTDETSDHELAKNWAAAIGVLPIFEGDVNTKLSAAGIGKGE
ncbi:ead/Ea22-like family protein [Citrobacter farmeri]